MKFLFVVLGALVGTAGYAQVSKMEDKAPTATTILNDNCPPPATPAVPKEKPDCKPKPKPVKPKPVKPKPKPKPKPAPKPAPVPPPAKDCPEPKVIEKTVEKTKYVDRTVTIDTAPKNTLSVLAGVGPHGLVFDSFATKERKDEYALRKEQDKADGAVVGLQYQYRFTPSFSATGLVLSNPSYLGGVGFSW